MPSIDLDEIANHLDDAASVLDPRLQEPPTKAARVSSEVNVCCLLLMSWASCQLSGSAAHASVYAQARTLKHGCKCTAGLIAPAFLAKLQQLNADIRQAQRHKAGGPRNTTAQTAAPGACLQLTHRHACRTTSRAPCPHAEYAAASHSPSAMGTSTPQAPSRHAGCEAALQPCRTAMLQPLCTLHRHPHSAGRTEPR